MERVHFREKNLSAGGLDAAQREQQERELIEQTASIARAPVRLTINRGGPVNRLLQRFDGVSHVARDHRPR